MPCRQPRPSGPRSLRSPPRTSYNTVSLKSRTNQFRTLGNADSRRFPGAGRAREATARAPSPRPEPRPRSWPVPRPRAVLSAGGGHSRSAHAPQAARTGPQKPLQEAAGQGARGGTCGGCRAPRRRRDRHPTTGTRLCPAPGPPRSAGTSAVSDIVVLGSVLPWKMAEGLGSPTSSSGSGPLPTPPELEGQHEAGAPPRAHPAQSRTFLLARQCPQHSPWGPGPTGEASPEKPGVTAAPTQPCQSKGGHRGPRRAAPPCPPASQQTLVLGAQQQERVRDLGRGKGHQEQGQETGHTGDKPIKHRGLQDEAEPFPPHPPRAWPSR